MSIYMWRDVTPAWIYHNSTLWLITIADGSWNDITIADKNLWATQVYNDGDALSEANCGKYFQWWNNYWFPFTWPVTTSSTQVNANTYWPWNYYSSSTFIMASPRDNSNNANLRWWTTWTVEAMQWPCASGFHIPTDIEWKWLIDMWVSISAWTSTWWDSVRILLKMPFAWWILYNNATISWQWTQWQYWASTQYSSTNAYRLFMSWTNMVSQANYYKSTWYSIRPFKNTTVQPDESWTVLYQPS